MVDFSLVSIVNCHDRRSTIEKGAPPTLLRALIFDFDGIIVDSEPIILKLTQEMAALEGWTVSEEEYYHDYLALDDRGIVEHLYASHGRPVDAARRDELVAWKGQRYQEIIRDGLPPMPGVVDFVTEMAKPLSPGDCQRQPARGNPSPAHQDGPA